MLRYQPLIFVLVLAALFNPTKADLNPAALVLALMDRPISAL